jgi:hydrogenase expression/formation protein HypC
MEIVTINGMRGSARLGAVTREVNLMLVPEVTVGQYVIIHAGSAISTLDPIEAQKTLDLMAEMGIVDINTGEAPA